MPRPAPARRRAATVYRCRALPSLMACGTQRSVLGERGPLGPSRLPARGRASKRELQLQVL
eukprot:2204591-Prymnesium_polylepis.1